jgi:2-polyprenyl-3-methyl-5-hydroxy-6-metoxy-1,4-benzoquinol methylase
MTTPTLPFPTVEQRARETRGMSGDAVYRLVARALRDRHQHGGTLLDVGCGTGALWAYLSDHFDRYIGSDAVRYDELPDGSEFHQVDIDTGRIPLPDESADVVVAVETIEHVENPRAFVRELTRLTRPGGLVIITTPNQLSLLSKLTLLLKNHFNAFAERPGLYPAHITALLEIDLLRIARECGLAQATVQYTNSGRIPGTARRWPFRLGGRAFSDNVLMAARRPS